jgi:ABC-type transport system involved in multi-copper enzyme maturation permease subunit
MTNNIKTIRVIRSELYKTLKAPSLWVVGLIVMAFELIIAFAMYRTFGNAMSEKHLHYTFGFDSTEMFPGVLLNGPAILMGLFFATFVASKIATVEYSADTMSSALAIVPARGKLILSKLMVTGFICFVFTAIMEFLSVLAFQIATSGFDYALVGQSAWELIFEPKSLLFIVIPSLGVAVASALAFSIGVWAKNNAISIVINMVVFILIPAFVPEGMVGKVLKYLPGKAVDDFVQYIVLTGCGNAPAHQVFYRAVTFLGTCVIASVIALYCFRQRDGK